MKREDGFLVSDRGGGAEVRLFDDRHGGISLIVWYEVDGEWLVDPEAGIGLNAAGVEALRLLLNARSASNPEPAKERGP